MKWLLVLAVSTGCKSREVPQVSPPPSVPVDAAVSVVVDASAMTEPSPLAKRLDDLAPVGKPPSPLVRKFARGDCRTDYAPRPDRDPNPMCRVTGGTFRMGGTIDKSLAPAFSSADPPVEITVGDFDIDQFKVTMQQAAHFLNAHGNDCSGGECLSLFQSFEQTEGRWRPLPGKELNPAFFEFEGAARYCAWVGKQIPTSAEWEYAARHDPNNGKDLTYPWGDAWSRDRISCSVKAICAEYTGSVGRNDGTGKRLDGSSPWGIHDAVSIRAERLVACREPLTTCRVGLPCPCTPIASIAGQDLPEGHTTYARLRMTDVATGLRCMRRR